MTSSTATLIVPPRPELPPRPAAEAYTASGSASVPPDLPPGRTLPSRGAPSATGGASEPTRAASTSAGLRSTSRWPRLILGAYAIVLTLIALWPVPVDSGAGPLLGLVTRVFPVLTYARIEFGANILLFVPLGILLALILQHRHLVVPIALIATVTIESLQGVMIDKRSPTVMDIIANLAGACIGLVIVAFVEWRRARREAQDRVATAR